MQFKVDEPLYKQVAESLRRDIQARRFTGKVPGERELSQRYSVNFKTANKAVASLVNEGLLTRVKGKGTFVSRTKPTAALTLVGLSVSQLENPYFSKSVRAIERAAARDGISLMLHTPEDNGSVSLAFAKSLVARGAQGLVMQGNSMPAAIRKLNLAVAAFGAGEADCDFVCADVLSGARQVVGHLVERFGPAVAYVGISHDARDERLAGYLEILKRAGVRPQKAWMPIGPNSYRGGYEATKALLSNGQRPRAIFYFNDYMAMGGQRALAEAGLRVPKDIAVAGFDDSVDPNEMVVPTTSVLYSFEQTAEELLSMLRRRVANPKGPPERATIAPVLRIRQSTSK